MDDELTDADQLALRRFFRHHWSERVAFNRSMGLRIARWEPDGVTFEIDYREDLGAHPGIFHGGVVASLIDTCGTGAVMAGHDFRRGSRLSTISMSVQYLGAAPNEGLVGLGTCTQRGRSTHFAEVAVRSSQSSRLVAQGLVSCTVTGRREGFDEMLALARSRFADGPSSAN